MSDSPPAPKRYFVEIGGQRFGPSDLDTLIQWKSDGRLSPSSILIDETTDQRLPARDLEGLFPPGSAHVPPPVAGHTWIGQAPPPTYDGYTPQHRGFPVWAIVVCSCGGVALVCCAILAAVLIPVFNQAKVLAEKNAEKAYSSQTSLEFKHFKELGLATVIYTTDNDGLFPPDMSDAQAAEPCLLPYAGSGYPEKEDNIYDIFVSVNLSGGDILGNTKLAGVDSQLVVSPDTAVLFYDEKPWPRGEGVVAYADGYTKVESSFTTITQKLARDPLAVQDSSTKQPLP